MNERGHIAIRQGILGRPRWPYFRKYLGIHLRRRLGMVACWGIDAAGFVGWGFGHIGAAIGLLVAGALLIPMAIPGALFFAGQFSVRYLLTLRAANRIKARESAAP